MKKYFLTIIIFMFCSPTSAYSQTSTTTGYVFNDKDQPEAGIVVVVNGSTGVTLADGKFTIDFKSPVQPGTPMIISVEKQGWAVLIPFMGEEQIQNKELNSNPLRITIAPLRSPRFLENSKLSELTAAMQIAAATLQLETRNKSEIEAAREREKTRVLEAYAKLSGFEVKVIRAAQQEWSTITRGLRNRDEALRAYSNKEFNKSGHLFLEEARDIAAMRNKLKKELQNSDKETIDAYMRSGASYLEGSQFKEALGSFNELEKRYFATGEISKESNKYEWLGLKFFIGRTKVQLSYQARQDEAITLLKDGIDNIKQALNATTREQFLDMWAQLQHGLGIALAELGSRTSSKEGITNLNLALEALNEAAISDERLQRAGRLGWPPYITHMSLGNTWMRLGEKTIGKESVDYLNKALAALDKGAKLVKSDDSLGWVYLKSGTGRAFGVLASRTSDPVKGEEYINKAIAAFEEANLIQNTPYSGPNLIGLGIAWGQLAERTSDITKSVEHLDKALDAFERASRIIKREDDLLNWASLKHNVGRALSDLASRTDDPAKREQHLNKAVAALEESQEIADQVYSPYVDANLTGLGVVRMQLSEMTGDPVKSAEHLGKALDAFDSASKRIKRDDLLAWAGLQYNIGRALSILAGRTGDPAKREDYLNKAVAAFNEAAKYAAKQNASAWADTMVGLAEAYSLLKNWTGALEASNSVLQAFPDDYRANVIKLGVLHDGLFQFEEAFILAKQWLDRHPNDLLTETNFAENYFTTGRFAESIQLINKLLPNPSIPVYVKIALQAIKIGCLLATN